ncbi:MAG: hypothetical protein AABY64_06120 [Bdellovibrionota bacterium]
MFSNSVVFKKRLVFILLTLATIFVSETGFAMDGGSRDGGGGDSLVSDFVAYANALFSQYPGDASEKALLKETLKNSKIVSVQTLKNPVSGNEIPDQAKLIAWGSPGLIQLKLDSGKLEDESWDAKVRKGEAGRSKL